MRQLKCGTPLKTILAGVLMFWACAASCLSSSPHKCRTRCARASLATMSVCASPPSALSEQPQPYRLLSVSDRVAGDQGLASSMLESNESQRMA